MRKNKKKHLNELMTTKISAKEKNRAQTFADIYAEGNLSEWVRYCLRNYTPGFVNKKSTGRRP